MKHIIPITLLVLCLCVLPAAAVIQEVTLKGTVSAISRENNTLTIADPARYGCDYPAAGSPVCSFTPIDSIPLEGSVPADSAFSVFAVGDSVVAKSLGGMGGRWITLAKLSGTAESGETVVDIVGDPASIPTPLAGDYSIDLSTEPDCTTCSGTTCTAKTTYVKIMSGKTLALAQDLEPGHAMTYNGRNDGSSITVTFMKGQAASSSCAGTGTRDDRPAGHLGVYRPRGPADRGRWAGRTASLRDPNGSDDAGRCPANTHEVRHVPGRRDWGACPRGDHWHLPPGVRQTSCLRVTRPGSLFPPYYSPIPSSLTRTRARS